MKNLFFVLLSVLLLAACQPEKEPPVEHFSQNQEEMLTRTREFLERQNEYQKNGGRHPELIILYPESKKCDTCYLSEWEFRGTEEGRAYHAVIEIGENQFRLTEIE